MLVDNVEWVSGEVGGKVYRLCENIYVEERGYFWVWEEERLTRVVEPEIKGSIKDDARKLDTEASIQSKESI